MKKCRSSKCIMFCKNMFVIQCNLEKRFNIVFKSDDIHRVVAANSLYFSKSRIENNVFDHMTMVYVSRYSWFK